MRKIGSYLFVFASLSVAACDSDKPACDTAEGCALAPDLAASPDLGTSTDLSMSDGGGSFDPDLSANTVLEIDCSLLSANIQGGTNNGFSTDCDAAGITQLQLNALGKSNTSYFVAVPCPAGNSNGAGSLILPIADGPYTVYGTAIGKPSSSSERIKDVLVPQTTKLTLRIYVEGCDAPVCQ